MDGSGAQTGQPTPGPWGPPPPVLTSWQGAPPQRKGTSRVLVWSLVGVTLLVAACLGTAGYGAFRVLQAAPSGAVPDRPLSSPGAAPADDDETEDMPKASTYPVREEDDLERVCDQWYYPQSPKRQGKGAHPVSIMVKGKDGFGGRSPKSLYKIPNRSSSAVEKAWNPEKPATVQLVACVDRVGSGKRLKFCAFDDPKLKKVSLYRGKYRFALYEVATGRKLVTRSMTGDEEDCPMFALIGTDLKIYSEVSDRQLYEVLRRYVGK